MERRLRRRDGQVYAAAPDDLDVVTLYADALMNLTPWQLWDLTTGEPAVGARTAEAQRALDLALHTDEALVHPGILHMYIHLMEMSPEPERAQPVSDRLRGLVPDAGHLHHMPSHLDVICGDYRAAIRANTAAVTADEKYRRHAGAMNFYTLYRCHNYHFIIYAAMFLGQRRVALEAVAGLEASIPDDLLRVTSPPMADWLEGFLAMRVHVLIRFGEWAEIVLIARAGRTPTSTAFPSPCGITPAASLSLRPGGSPRPASNETRSGARSTASRRPDDLQQHLPRHPGGRLALLDGELNYRNGHHDAAFADWAAVELDDTCPTTSRGRWMQPTRHALGALLLEQGRVEQAHEVYTADLGVDPPSLASASIRTTSGRWSACTSAWSRWAGRRGRDHRCRRQDSPPRWPTSR